ncbi:phage distal tail protein, partial [Pseudogracilibacillus auburnensis]|uniref:phage distal tail protein n=1 Tax=Pseudogracilibacillus auburnensis TaxID=1494959 RepID=UPI001A95A072
VWNDGRFLLKIARKGKEFSARIARKLDPNGYAQTGRHSLKYNDTRNEYQNPITQIAVYMARARSFVNFSMLFHHLTVRKLINHADYEVPLVAQADDEIVFNHKTGDCYVNGDPVPFDFGADFFKLQKGRNIITVLPENAFQTSIKYRDKYL